MQCYITIIFKIVQEAFTSNIHQYNHIHERCCFCPFEIEVWRFFSKCTSRRTFWFIIFFYFQFLYCTCRFTFSDELQVSDNWDVVQDMWHFYRFGATQVLHMSGVGYDRLPCIQYVFYFPIMLYMLTCYHLISLLPDTACLLQKSK